MDYRNECAICGEKVDDDEVIHIRRASGTMAHDSHSARQVREARIAAGADPDTAEDAAPCERSRSDLFCRTHLSYWRPGSNVCELVVTAGHGLEAQPLPQATIGGQLRIGNRR